MTDVKCTKCGAPIKFDTGDKFAKCEYCGTQIFIDKSGVVFFYIMPFFIDGTNARGIFKRWTAGSTMAKDLEARAQVSGIKQLYFPVYLFKRDVGGKEVVHVEPARSTTLPGLHSLKVPAGDIKVYDKDYPVGDIELLKPDIDMSAYLPGLQGAAKEQSLVYFPIWTFRYQYNGQAFDAVIDGSSGEVFAADYPVRHAAPYFIIAAMALFVFFIEGMLGQLIFGLGLIAAVPTIPVIFLASHFILRRF
jgi:DNA-directed RNA polymerase subunit RPC12/RpoP